VLSTVVLALTVVGQTRAAETLPAGQAQAVLQRMLDTEAFVGSQEESQQRQFVARHFSEPEYARLRGNPLLGYWDEGGFRWPSGQDSIAWDGIRNLHRSSRPISRRSWALAFKDVARKQRLVVQKGSAIRVQGACVGAVVDRSEREPVPGVLLELRVSSPEGTLLYRVGVGKATVEDAMGAALELAVAFARSLGERGKETGHGAQR
jgi:hypothetical protein